MSASNCTNRGYQIIAMSLLTLLFMLIQLFEFDLPTESLQLSEIEIQFTEEESIETTTLTTEPPIECDNCIDIFLCTDEISRPGLYTVMNSIIVNHDFSVKNSNNAYIYFHILVETNMDLFVSEFHSLFQSVLRNDSISVYFEFKSFQNFQSLFSFFDRNHRTDLSTHDIHNQYIFQKMNYARFYLPQIFTNVRGNAIYFDIDMIVRSDVSLMFEQTQSRNDCPLFAVFNAAFPSMFDTNNSKGLAVLGIESVKFGFNAGAVLYNVTHWRVHNFTNKYEEIMRVNKAQKSDIFKLGTQPIMNVLYFESVLRNAQKCKLIKWWNCIGFGSDHITGVYWQRLKEFGNIFHWTGADKPWLKCKRKGPRACAFIHKDTWRQYLPIGFDRDNIQNWNAEWNFNDGDFGDGAHKALE